MNTPSTRSSNVSLSPKNCDEVKGLLSFGLDPMMTAVPSSSGLRFVRKRGQINHKISDESDSSGPGDDTDDDPSYSPNLTDDVKKKRKKRFPLLFLILHMLQNCAERFVYNICKFDHITSYRRKASVLTIKEICRRQTVTIVHKVLDTGRPAYLNKRLMLRSAVRERHTRQDAMLQLPRVHLERGKRGFSDESDSSDLELENKCVNKENHSDRDMYDKGVQNEEELGKRDQVEGGNYEEGTQNEELVEGDQFGEEQSHRMQDHVEREVYIDVSERKGNTDHAEYGSHRHNKNKYVDGNIKTKGKQVAKRKQDIPKITQKNGVKKSKFQKQKRYKWNKTAIEPPKYSSYIFGKKCGVTF
ncbi:hypothetical protein J6590_029226 [Homalodisca vitripennis]|nr:hypothetical protein J6590_029226 [Homalodisca vitripennis]